MLPTHVISEVDQVVIRSTSYGLNLRFRLNILILQKVDTNSIKKGHQVSRRPVRLHVSTGQPSSLLIWAQLPCDHARGILRPDFGSGCFENEFMRLLNI